MKGISIDSVSGGLGDTWMRLLALYTLKEMVASPVHVAAPASLVSTARAIFGERIEVTETPRKESIVCGHRGIWRTLRQRLSGARFNLPYIWVNLRDARTARTKVRLQAAVASAASACGLVLVPRWETAHAYQGLMQLSGIPEFRRVEVRQFEERSVLDLNTLQELSQRLFPKSSSEPHLILPSGRGHQSMPVQWAKRHALKGHFGFHVNDPVREEFAQAGLKTVLFDNPESLLLLATRYAKILATDSFPSHLLQTWSQEAMILLTQQAARRVIHPGYRGPVVNSRAACSPCRYVYRGACCEAGYSHCLTWEMEAYTRDILHFLSSPTAP